MTIIRYVGVLAVAGCNTFGPLQDPADSDVAADAALLPDAAASTDAQLTGDDGEPADVADDIPPSVDLSNDVNDADEPAGPKDSTVCTGEVPAAKVDSPPRYRLRVTRYFNDVLFAAIRDGIPDIGTFDGTDARLELGEELQIDGGPPSGVRSSSEVTIGTPTGIAVAYWGGQPIWSVTRHQQNDCAFVESGTNSSTSINCGAPTTLWGAEITNWGPGPPQYFWFDGSGGMISAMSYDDTAAGGGQLLVPWCLSRGAGCAKLDIAFVDARANDREHILLGDSDGDAYVWDTLQLDDAMRAGPDVDCTIPTDPPLALREGDQPLKFANVDMVWEPMERRAYLLIEQQPDAVRLRQLGTDFAPEALVDSIAHSDGLRPLFDAVTSGSNVAAVTADDSGFTVYAFEGAGTKTVSQAVPGIGAIQLVIQGTWVFVIYVTADGVFARRYELW